VLPGLPPVAPTYQPSPARPEILTFGSDISWPNCPLGSRGFLPKRPAKGLDLPGPLAQFVVIGLTNGPGFYPNPCLASQVADAKRRHLFTAAYAFTTMPNRSQVAQYGGSGPWSSRTALGRMRNAAYAEAQVNVRSIQRTGLRTPIVWMDVEPQDYISPWGTDVTTNRAVIRAAQLAYHRAGFTTGFYSAPYAWTPITGGLQDPAPVWVTSGPRSRSVAEGKCGARSFSGGPITLSQFWVVDVGDYDVTCPVLRAEPAHFFAAN